MSQGYRLCARDESAVSLPFFARILPGPSTIAPRAISVCAVVMARQPGLREIAMNTACVELASWLALRRAAAGRGEWLANWLALIALLALGIVWQ
jgi:hypothetical protein